MKLHLGMYRYASAREPGEGLRIGTARFVPRGVRKECWQRQGYFDLWLPLLAPSAEAVERYRHGKMTYAQFSLDYRRAMKERERRQVIELLAGVSLFLPISIGCFCEDETKCHRSVLRKLIAQAAEQKQADFRTMEKQTDLMRFASPVCFANWEE